MKAPSSTRRKKAVSAAVWSVKAEGLRPTKAASKSLGSYASGKISAKQLRAETARNVKNLLRTSK